MNPSQRFNARVIKNKDYQAMPWKNGLGTSYEIFSQENIFRLAIADIKEIGPFSKYTGYDRWITLADELKSPFEIRSDSTQHYITFGKVIKFSGDAETSVTRLEKPSQDLNLLFKRGKGKADLLTLQAGTKPKSLELESDITLFVFLNGSSKIQIFPGEIILNCNKGDTLLIEDNNALSNKNDPICVLLEPKNKVALAIAELTASH